MGDDFRIETSPDERDIQALDRRIYEFNAATTGITDGEELAIFVRDDDGAIRAGLYGWTWSGWLEVRILWLHEEERGRGLGSRLLAAAEEEARRRGCHTAIVGTHSFQAPAFYQKRGYQVYAELDGYPTGHSSLSLRKRLREPEDVQGDQAG